MFLTGDSNQIKIIVSVQGWELPGMGMFWDAHGENLWSGDGVEDENRPGMGMSWDWNVLE